LQLVELFERERELAAIDRLLEDGGVLVVGSRCSAPAARSSRQGEDEFWRT